MSESSFVKNPGLPVGNMVTALAAETEREEATNDTRDRLNGKLDILLFNKENIEKKLKGNGIDADRRKCLEYQLRCLETPISTVTSQIMNLN